MQWSCFISIIHLTRLICRSKLNPSTAKETWLLQRSGLWLNLNKSWTLRSDSKERPMCIKNFRRACAAAITTFAAALLIINCGGGGGGGSSNSTTGTQTSSPSVTVPVVNPAHPYSGTVTLATGKTETLTVPANSLSTTDSVTLTNVTSSKLPVSLAATPALRVASSVTTKRTMRSLSSVSVKSASHKFQPSANNVYVTAFQISLSPTQITTFSVPMQVTGSGVVPLSIAAGTVLNIAFLAYQGTTNAAWTDVGTYTVGSGGAFTGNLPTASEVGITQPGLYVLYVPATGNTTVANYGVALLGADSGYMSVINIYGSNGLPVASPPVTQVNIANSYDLDGQSLTPDGHYGVLVDGSNTVSFFTGASGVYTASQNTLDISQFGGDGDSVVITPNGDTAVVTGDGTSSELVTISGISSGTPALTSTIATPASRCGLVMSNDGKVMLARGVDAVTAYAVAPQTPVAGSLGGSANYSFTQTANLTALGDGGNTEDGRDGMAMSPVDSSRAVVVLQDPSTGAPTLTELTGLPQNPVAHAVRLRAPAPKTRYVHIDPEDRGRKERPRLVLNGVAACYSVSITLDGKMAVVGTDTGLILVSGIDTASPTQVGTTSFNPNYTYTPTGGSATTQTLGQITSLAITLDNKYVIAVSTEANNEAYASVLTFPFTSTGFGAAVSQADNIALPYNDQIVVH
jgi:hypothetical protein